MALLLDKLLAVKDDFVSFRDISANLKEVRLNVFIREAQTIELRGFIGKELWLLIQNDYDEVLKTFTDERFEKLWFGADFNNYAGVEVRFNGLMNALIYFAYARFMNQQQVNVSRFGVESVQNDISEDITTPQIRAKAKDALQVALAYQGDCKEFLEAEKLIYPEYVESNTKPKKTSFSFFKL